MSATNNIDRRDYIEYLEHVEIINCNGSIKGINSDRDYSLAESIKRTIITKSKD